LLAARRFLRRVEVWAGSVWPIGEGIGASLSPTMHMPRRSQRVTSPSSNRGVAYWRSNFGGEGTCEIRAQLQPLGAMHRDQRLASAAA
jgi:hypothetical protein